MLDVQDRAKRILEYAQMRSLILPYFPNEIGDLTSDHYSPNEHCGQIDETVKMPKATL